MPFSKLPSTVPNFLVIAVTATVELSESVSELETVKIFTASPVEINFCPQMVKEPLPSVSTSNFKSTSASSAVDAVIVAPLVISFTLSTPFVPEVSIVQASLPIISTFSNITEFKPTLITFS